MLEGMREDVRAVWDAIPVGGYLLIMDSGGLKEFTKETEEDWDRLELYLDTEDPVEAQNEEN